MKKQMGALLAAAFSAFSADATMTITSQTITSASNGGYADSGVAASGSMLFNFDNYATTGAVNGFTLSNNNPFLSSNVAVVRNSDFFGTYSAPTGDTTPYLKIGANVPRRLRTA